MADAYDRFQDARVIAKNDWERNFVLRYGSAYNTAFTNFFKELEEQEKTRQKRAEMMLGFAFMALSLCGGSILTTVFGKAVAKEAAAKVALDVICNREMERAFKVAAFVADNKTAQFVLGTLWDEAGSKISSELKNSLKESTSNFPSIGKFAQEPLNLQNMLREYVLDAYDVVVKAGRNIADNNKGADREQKLRELMKAPFIAAAPKRKLDEEKTRIEIELTFFMRYLLQLDYLAKGHWIVTNYAAHKITDKRVSIDKSPWSKSYPKGQMYGPKNTFQEVKYRQLELNVEEKIEELHKAKFKKCFFTWYIDVLWGTDIQIGDHYAEQIDRDVLKRAHDTLEELGRQNVGAINRSLRELEKN